jgi:anti-anti-sigma factor
MKPDQPVLRVLESRSADGTLVLSVQGEIDLATVGTLAAHFDRICDRADAVIVDLQRVGFLDCTGLRHLIELHCEAVASGCRVRFIQGPAPVRRVFELTGTASMLSFGDGAALQPAVGAPT